MGHGTYGKYLYRPAMYEWMLMHRRGQEPPAGRADDRQILSWAFQDSIDVKYERFSKKLQEQFSGFRPYWFVETCWRSGSMGPREEALGRKNVFATRPMNRHIPCRLMTTADVPAGKKTKLVLEVAAKPDEPWQLIVRVDSKEQLARTIKSTEEVASAWQTIEVDLTEHAGREAFVEVLNAEGEDKSASIAYWGRIDLVSTDK